MAYDGEVREDEWCPNHSCYVWQCPQPTRPIPPAKPEEAPDARA